MKTMLSCLLGASLLALGFAAPLGAQELPPEAQQIISSAKQDFEAIQRRAEDEQKQRGAKLTQQLGELINQLKAQGRNDAAEQIVRFVAGQDVAPVSKVEVEWHGTWYPAVVLKREGNRTYIKYEGYGDEWNEWVGPERIRGLEIKQPKEVARAAPVVGTAVEILWGGTWWPGKLLESANGKHHISYDNFGPEWNEWVGPDRIRPLKKAAGANRFPPETNVDIEWLGTWFPGKVLKIEENRWFISYDNYGEHWNEWVGPERIRARNAKSTLDPNCREEYDDSPDAIRRELQPADLATPPGK